MERMESVLRRFHLMKEPRESEARQQLKRELFAFNSCVEHGFPNKPTTMAFDTKLQLLAVGNKSGDIRIYGRPGVEFSGHHTSFVAVSYIFFLPGQGRLVTVCSDNSIHLWQLDAKDGQTNFHEVKAVSPDASKLRPVTAACLTPDGRHLILGTEAGTVHRLDVLSLQFADKVIQQETIVSGATGEAKANPGKIESLVHHPTASDQLLIGFKHGLIVLWNEEENSVAQTYLAPQLQNLESLAFDRSGNEFLSTHSDGSYITWTTNDSSRPKEQANTPYGPFPCKPITRIQWKSSKIDPFIIFSGGMPRASHGDRHTVSVIQGESHVAFDLSSEVVDLIVLCSGDQLQSEYDEPRALLILAEEELIAIDLITPGWPAYELPYLNSIHASAILCASHVTNVPQGLWDRIVGAGSHSSTKISTKDWPIQGGKDLRSDPTSRELLLTGHEDGSVRFWDVSGTSMHLVYKLSTSVIFGIETATADVPKSPEGEDEWPPFRKVGCYDPFSDDPQLGIQRIVLCCSTDMLFVGGTAGQVIVFCFEEQPKDCEVKTIPLVIVREQDAYVWKGQEPLNVKTGSHVYLPGFQPTCVVQVQPPAMCSALTVNEEWQLLALGTAHGFGVIDYDQKKSVFDKCTLGSSSEPATPRRRSLRKSLRESFRRLRKRRIPMLHRRTPALPTEPKPSTSAEAGAATKAAEETKIEAPASATPAAEATEAPAQKETTAAESQAEAPATATGSSSPPSPTATTPPVSPQRSAEKPEPRSTDELTTSIVRCLCFADTFIVNAQEHGPSLWAGTNAGTVYVHQLKVPSSDKRSTDEVECTIAKEIQLRHRAPVVSVFVVDRAMQSLSGHLSGRHPIAKPSDMSGSHQVVVCSEEQIKIFALPSLKAVGKCKLAGHDGSRIRKASLIAFSSKSDDNYIENDLGCLTTTGEVHILSLPQLRKQMKADGIKCDSSSVNASFFTLNGEAFFLNSASEYLRLSLSARYIVRPTCLIEVNETDRPALQLEPEQPQESPKEESTKEPQIPAPEVQVVITSDEQTPPSPEIIQDKTGCAAEQPSSQPEDAQPSVADPSADNVADSDESQPVADGSHSESNEVLEVVEDGATGDSVIMHFSEHSSSSSSSVVKNVVSSKTVVTKTTVSMTTSDGVITETQTNVQHINSGGVEIVEGSVPTSV